LVSERSEARSLGAAIGISECRLRAEWACDEGQVTNLAVGRDAVYAVSPHGSLLKIAG